MTWLPRPKHPPSAPRTTRPRPDTAAGARDATNLRLRPRPAAGATRWFARWVGRRPQVYLAESAARADRPPAAAARNSRQRRALLGRRFGRGPQLETATRATRTPSRRFGRGPQLETAASAAPSSGRRFGRGPQLETAASAAPSSGRRFGRGPQLETAASAAPSSGRRFGRGPQLETAASATRTPRRWFGRRPPPVAVASAIAALAVGAAGGAAALWSRGELHGARGGGTFAAVGVAIALSLVGCGLAARRSRPASRTGALLIVAGLAWTGTSLKHATDWPGAVIGATLWAAVVLHLVLAFPSGRLPDRAARLVVVAGYFAVTVLQVLPFRTVQFVVVATVVVAAVVLLARRHARASTAERRSLAPVLWGGGMTLVVAALRLTSPPALEALASWATLAALGSLPFALLAGLFRSRLSALDGVARLMRRTHELLGPVQLRDALAQALGDPSLALAYWVPDRGHFVDAGGRPVALPDNGETQRRAVAEVPAAFGAPVAGRGRAGGRADIVAGVRATLAGRAGSVGDVAGGGETQGREVVDVPPALGAGDAGARAVTRIGEPRPIAAILHDPSLDPGAVRAAGAAAALWLDRERLEAELRARVAELRDSRARLVATADAERRRIERDLHDGAQQRIASLLLHLELERRALGPGAAAEVLDGVAAGLADSLAELRALAAGILPPVLRQDGLVAAIEELATRTALPVSVEALPHERLPDGIEVAAYFFVAEGLANVVKHARAQSANVRVARDRGHAIIEVMDDGRGGADEHDGSGLRGLRDRVGALGGRLDCHSPSNGGTVLRAEIPCAS